MTEDEVTVDIRPHQHGLYVVEGTDQLVSTHSMLKAFRRCPKQAEYKYVRRLKPRRLGRPLRLGTWMHRLQEIDYRGDDWREEHKILSRRFNDLFDEEKDEIGDLPNDCRRLMESYLWHYADDPWIVHETEFILEAELPDGSILRGRVDNLIENQYGLWIVDHKWHRSFPSHEYRILDQQSVGYLWLALKNNIPVQGHIWNYGRSKAPVIPTLTKKTGVISRWAKLDTDYLTVARYLRDHPELPRAAYMAKLRVLRNQRYKPGEPQSSPFFRRVVVEKNKAMIEQGIRELYHTHKRMHNYPFDNPLAVERVPDRSCTFMCSYIGICSAELSTGKTPVNWRQSFSVGDPLDYYNDDRKDEEDKV